MIAIFVHMMAMLRAQLRQIGPNLRLFGANLRQIGPTWAQLASIWRQLRPTCYQFGVDAPHFASKPGTINVKIIIFSLVFVCFPERRPSCNVEVHLGPIEQTCA